MCIRDSHICRLATDSQDQRELTMDLVKRYVAELQSWQERNAVECIEVVASLPIENESRKLPKTGYFKGKPFWGTWEERDSVHKVFNEALNLECQKNGFSFITWPDNFTNEAGELDFRYMEKPRSVHVSPEHYMWEI